MQKENNNINGNIKDKLKQNKNQKKKINIKKLNKDEYKEYWTDKGVIKANHTENYKIITEEKEKKFNMIVELSIPWQRKAIEELIDDIKSMENARSSIEMDNTLELIYNNENVTQKNKI